MATTMSEGNGECEGLYQRLEMGDRVISDRRSIGRSADSMADDRLVRGEPAIGDGQSIKLGDRLGNRLNRRSPDHPTADPYILYLPMSSGSRLSSHLWSRSASAFSVVKSTVLA